MVISRFMRRLLLVTAICLPMQMLPDGAAAASGSGSLAFLAKLTTLVGGILFAPTIASIVPKAKETAKAPKSTAGNIFGRALYSAWNYGKGLASWYWGAGRDVVLTTYNTPTYLRGCFDSSLGWDKTDRKPNQETALANYKVAEPNYGHKQMIPLYVAIITGNEKAVQAWLDASAGFYAYHFNDGPMGTTEMTGLMLAATFAQPKIADLFLKYRWNINYQDKNLKTALMHTMIIPEELIKRYNETNSPSDKNALRKNQEENRARIAADLISNGANIALVDKQERNALHHAAANNLYGALKEVANAMEDQGIDLNAKDATGRTALVYAVQKFAVNSVKLLAETHHAAINAGSNDDSDALALARRLMQPLAQRFETVKGQIKSQMQRGQRTTIADDAVAQATFSFLQEREPVVFQKYCAMLEIYKTLQKLVNDSAPQNYADISYTVSEASNGWIQAMGEVQEDFGFDATAFTTEPVAAPQTVTATKSALPVARTISGSDNIPASIVPTQRFASVAPTYATPANMNQPLSPAPFDASVYANPPSMQANANDDGQQFDEYTSALAPAANEVQTFVRTANGSIMMNAAQLDQHKAEKARRLNGGRALKKIRHSDTSVEYLTDSEFARYQHRTGVKINNRHQPASVDYVAHANDTAYTQLAAQYRAKDRARAGNVGPNNGQIEGHPQSKATVVQRHQRTAHFGARQPRNAANMVNNVF